MNKVVAISFFLAVFAASLSIINLVKLEDQGGPTVTVAGVIRSLDERGWHAIDDSTHSPLNIEAVEVKNGLIIVRYGFKASKIHSFVVAPDETFAKEGLLVGASVASDHARILVSQIVAGTPRVIDASTIRSKLGNFWIYGVFSVED